MHVSLQYPHLLYESLRSFCPSLPENQLISGLVPSESRMAKDESLVNTTKYHHKGGGRIKNMARSRSARSWSSIIFRKRAYVRHWSPVMYASALLRGERHCRSVSMDALWRSARERMASISSVIGVRHLLLLRQFFLERHNVFLPPPLVCRSLLRIHCRNSIGIKFELYRARIAGETDSISPPISQGIHSNGFTYQSSPFSPWNNGRTA